MDKQKFHTFKARPNDEFRCSICSKGLDHPIHWDGDARDFRKTLVRGTARPDKLG